MDKVLRSTGKPYRPENTTGRLLALRQKCSKSTALPNRHSEEPKPDAEIEKICCDACNYYENTIAKKPEYLPPTEYAAREFSVQRLCKGGFGNDTLYEYDGSAWKARSESDLKSNLAAIVTRHETIPDPTHTDKAYKIIMSTGKLKDVEA